MVWKSRYTGSGIPLAGAPLESSATGQSEFQLLPSEKPVGSPIRPPMVVGLNASEKPISTEMTLMIPAAERDFMSAWITFLRRVRPASNKPIDGTMLKTRNDASSIQAEAGRLMSI